MGIGAITAIAVAVAGLVQGLETIWRFLRSDGLSARRLLPRLVVVVGCSLIVLVIWMQPFEDSASDHYRQAKAYFAAKNRPMACEEARQVLRIQPTHLGALKLLGACAGIDRDYPTSVSEYKEAVRVDPDDIEAQIGLATALEAAGRHEEAGKAYRLVLRHPGSTLEQARTARAHLKADP